MKYNPEFLEIFVSDLLWNNNIKCIWDLHIEALAKAFNINVRYIHGDSCMARKGKKAIFSINKDLNEQQQYEDFLHELSHYILETRSFLQLNEQELIKVELKVDHIIQYIAMPYFLIDTIYKLETIEAVSEYFYVSYELARKRMESIKNRLIAEVT